jgi:TIR domain
MVSTSPYRVFLSHSSNDADLAKEIASQIEKEFENTLQVFVSERPDAISSGADWEKVVIQKLEEAEVLVFLMTVHSENRMWVGCELGYFWKKSGKEKIHTLHHPTAKVPSPLDTLQAKLVSDTTSLQSFFRGICNDLGKAYTSRANIDKIIDKANALLPKPPERSLKNFERLLSESEWEHIEIAGREVWLCVDDLLFQIINDDDRGPFDESWCKRILTMHQPIRLRVKLTLAGLTI